MIAAVCGNAVEEEMFWGIKRLIRTSGERLISLVLLPAFFLGTMPHTACICADGHREEFCKATLCRAIGQGSRVSSCCGCSCCKNAGGQQARSCCQKKGCQPTKGSGVPANGLTAKTGSCCNPFVEAAAPSTLAGKTNLGSQLMVVATIAAPSTFQVAEELHPALDRSSFSTPPPLDAVIVYLHLTI
jgi:hypothetical protein